MDQMLVGYPEIAALLGLAQGSLYNLQSKKRLAPGLYVGHGRWNLLAVRQAITEGKLFRVRVHVPRKKSVSIRKSPTTVSQNMYINGDGSIGPTPCQEVANG